MTDQFDMRTDWAEIDALLDQALSLEGSERRRWLASLDPGKRSRIEPALAGESARWVDTLVQVSLDGVFEQHAPPSMPDLIGPWRITGELGSGGMAQVYEGWREGADFQQRAAVKILWPMRADDSSRERFVEERRILANLNHPGIAGLLDGGVLPDGRPWFAMEYIDGVPVDVYCRPLSLNDRLEVFLQVCDAVEFAHARLIIHRDIKPANILVDASGRARLLDFGIARLIDDADREAATRTGGSLLTLQYASPEQVMRTPLTVATDVYQLGMLLFELAAGHPPFDFRDFSLARAVETIRSEQPSRPSAFNPAVSPDLDAVVLSALRKEPERRYPSVSALARDVRQYMERRPVAARPQGPIYVFSRFVRRNVQLVAAVTMLFVVLVAAAVVSLELAHRASVEADRSATALRVLTGVFDQANPFDQPGPDLTLGEALTERFDPIAAEVQHDPVLSALVFNRLGLIFNRLGMHEQSERAYRQAWDAALLASAEPGDLWFEATNGIATALNAQGRFQDTLAYIASLPEPRPPGAAAARSRVQLSVEQAEAHLAGGDAAVAARHLEDAQSIAAAFELGDAELNHLLHNMLADSARAQGDLEAALGHTRIAAESAGEAGQPDAKAVLLQNLGIYLGSQGRLEEAKPYYLEAMSIVDEYAPGHPSKLEFAANYAGWLYRSNHVQEAVDQLSATLGALAGTPDRHLWAYANRDLALYAFTAGDVETSLRANREYLLTAPPLYGLESPRVSVGEVLLARHLSLAGLHAGSLHVIQRAIRHNPVIGRFDLTAYLAELSIDAGQFEAARRAFVPGEHPEDENSQFLELKLSCAANDREALERNLGRFDPASLGDSHIDRRLLAWHGLLVTALLRPPGQDPRPELDASFEILSSTPRLSIIERWRLLRELLPLYSAAGPVPAAVQEAFDEIQRQRALARETLRQDYLPQDSPMMRGVDLSYAPAQPPRLTCLR